MSLSSNMISAAAIFQGISITTLPLELQFAPSLQPCCEVGQVCLAQRAPHSAILFDLGALQSFVSTFCSTLSHFRRQKTGAYIARFTRVDIDNRKLTIVLLGVISICGLRIDDLASRLMRRAQLRHPRNIVLKYL